MSTQPSAPSRFLRALRSANPALWPARMRLASLRAAYKAGSYSGHPEEMLEAIEGVEYKIRDWVNGKSRKTDPAPVVKPSAAKRVRSAQKQCEYEELTARCHKEGGPFEPGLEAAERRLAYMENLYRYGGFMGHPEDLMEDIETERQHIKRLMKEEATKAF